MSPSPPVPPVSVVASEMSARVRDFDWASTPLGQIAQWPAALRVAVGICLNSRFPMFVWWGPELINIYNDAYVPMLGARHPEALGRPAKASWLDIWDIVGEQARLVMEEGHATWNERVHLAMERHGYREDTYFTWSYSPICDEEGRVGGLFCAVTEETASVNAERERDRLLTQAEGERARLAAAFEQAPAFLAIMRGPRHTFEYVNASYVSLLGGRPLVGRDVRDAVPEIAGQGFFEILDRVYETGEPYVGRSVHIRLQRAAGRPLEDIFIDFVYQPIRDTDGHIAGVMAHGVDMTALREALEAEQSARGEAERASRMKDEFLATLSHELRTPLNAILGWAHMLRRPEVGLHEVQRGAEVIERNARAQSTIIEDLLDMSAIISGKVRLQMQQVEVALAIRTAIDTARPTADAKRITLEARIDPASRSTVLGDPNRLQQVLWNLLTNAMKFTPPGGRIEVALHEDDGRVRIVVADTGEGIPADFLPFLFDRFRQADASTTRRHGGLGLGLSIVRHLAELHGGTVTAQSEGAGRGATFTVTLPAALEPRLPEARAADERPMEARSMPRAEEWDDIAGKRVLVVDDDADARDLVRRLLEECAVRVTSAGSSAEALALLQSQPFDALVSDIGMPGEDGHALMRRVRTLADKINAGVPALALTAYARPEDRAQAIQAGFQMHATKPVDPVHLLALVAGLVRQGRQRVESPVISEEGQ